ncbi:MAG: hypothetical protein ACREUZ_02160 [Burkholderiales bacterium]
MLPPRHLRVRVLEALDERLKQFRPREELWPLRVPHEPILMDDVIDAAIGDDRRSFDPITLRSRTLLHLEWPDGSAWEAWMAVLPSGFKLYGDSGDEETRLLASGGRNEGEDSDRAFLGLFAESAGAHFGIEMSGGAPAVVRSSIGDREFLAELFVNLFEMTGTEASVRAQLPPGEGAKREGGSDFRADVEEWLDRALRAKSAPRYGASRTFRGDRRR